MSKWDQIKEIKGLLASLVTAFTVVSIIGLAIMDWRIGVAVNMAFKDNLAAAQKIINMDTSIASNTRTGEENGEDIEQNRRANELAMRRLFGLPPPTEDTE